MKLEVVPATVNEEVFDQINHVELFVGAHGDIVQVDLDLFEIEGSSHSIS